MAMTRTVLLMLLAAAPLCAAAPVPVLCYHGFVDDSVGSRGALTTTFGALESMLKFLAARRYVSCFPDEVRSGACTGQRRVILTFDDGTRDHLRAAHMLTRYGFKGIFFVIPRRVLTGSNRSLNAEELHELTAQGHRVAPHGYAHRMMPESPEEVTASSQHSPPCLREILGTAYAGTDFAFPFGHYDAKTLAALAGTYRYLHTVNPGYWDGSSTLIPRMLVTTDEDPAFFEAYVVGAEAFHPVLTLVTGEGTVSPIVEFRTVGTPMPEGAEMMSVSPDLTGRLYTRHTLDTNIVVDGSRVLLNLKNHMKRYYAPERRIIAYALVIRNNGALHFLSSGHTHWIDEPLTTTHQTPSRNTYAD